MIDWTLIFHVAAGVVLGVVICGLLSVAISAVVLICRGLLNARHKPIRVPRYGRNP